MVATSTPPAYAAIDWTALGTWALAIGTLVLVWITKRGIADQTRISGQQLEVWKEVSRNESEGRRRVLDAQVAMGALERYRSPQMQIKRKALAGFLRSNFENAGTFSEFDVIEFFEQLGAFVQRGILSEELAWVTFRRDALRWYFSWKIYKNMTHRTLIGEHHPHFAQLADLLIIREAEHQNLPRRDIELQTDDDVARFLEAEKALTPR